MRLVTAGGRVLNVIGRGPTSPRPATRAYEAVAELSWPGLHHRTDIAAGGLDPARAGRPSGDTVRRYRCR